MGVLTKHLMYLGVSLIYPVFIYIMISIMIWDFDYFNWNYGIKDLYSIVSKVLFFGAYTLLVWNENKNNK